MRRTEWRPDPEGALSLPLGIRALGDRVDDLDSGDETTLGSYWFDLRARRPLAAACKRAIDVGGAAVLLVLLSPLLAVIAALVRLTSSGPAIFRQQRIGFRCNEFEMYKFRTMTEGSDQAQERLATAQARAFFKLPGDPRVTAVGRLLRRFSLDELPQLLNVLEGTMSLVGPRPLLLSDLHTLPVRGHMRRFAVKPGMTGLWQVSGRSSTTDEERMRLDREYVNRWSLWLDITILARTASAVLSGRGAS